VADPSDGAQFAEAVLRAAGDDSVRTRLISAGLERAGRYTWARTAELTDALLTALVGWN
jgi:hypothetical protein